MKDFDKNKVDHILFGVDANHSNRLEMFFKKQTELTDKEFWYGFSIAYQCTDDLYRFKDLIKLVLVKNIERPHRDYMMTGYERNYFNKLPNEIRLYRGMTKKESESNEFGISWTLSKKVAHFFAYTYQRNLSANNMQKIIYDKVFNKKDALCYLSSRKEKEILIIEKLISKE
jgi:hypothetical protein